MNRKLHLKCHAKTDHNEDHKNAGSMILLIPGDHVAVDRNAGAAVEVDARPVAAPQVAEHVAAARLQRGRPYQDRVYQVKNNTYCFFIYLTHRRFTFSVSTQISPHYLDGYT